MNDVPQSRFDALLVAMLSGPAPSAQKKSSADQSSGEAPDACCAETQIPQDASQDDDC